MDALVYRGGGRFKWPEWVTFKPALTDLSNPFQVGQIPGWIRGLRRVSDWVFWRILAFSSILYANRLRGSCSRKLSRFIA